MESVSNSKILDSSQVDRFIELLQYYSSGSFQQHLIHQSVTVDMIEWEIQAEVLSGPWESFVGKTRNEKPLKVIVKDVQHCSDSPMWEHNALRRSRRAAWVRQDTSIFCTEISWELKLQRTFFYILVWVFGYRDDRRRYDLFVREDSFW